jgi:hypothetical protein
MVLWDSNDAGILVAHISDTQLHTFYPWHQLACVEGP